MATGLHSTASVDKPSTKGNYVSLYYTVLSMMSYVVAFVTYTACSSKLVTVVMFSAS